MLALHFPGLRFGFCYSPDCLLCTKVVPLHVCTLHVSKRQPGLKAEPESRLSLHLMPSYHWVPLPQLPSWPAAPHTHTGEPGRLGPGASECSEKEIRAWLVGKLGTITASENLHWKGPQKWRGSRAQGCPGESPSAHPPLQPHASQPPAKLPLKSSALALSSGLCMPHPFPPSLLRCQLGSEVLLVPSRQLPSASAAI